MMVDTRDYAPGSQKRESTPGSIVVNLSKKLIHCRNVSSADDVELESYIAAWENMKQILDAMGSIFTFVSDEIDSKVGCMLAMSKVSRRKKITKKHFG